MQKINYKLLVVFLLIALQSSLFGVTYYVSITGNDTNPGTEAKPWRTINYGVDNMASGSTLYIRSGTYQIAVKKTIKSGIDMDNRTTITSHPDDTDPVIINGGGYFYLYGKDYWVINGLDFIHLETARAAYGIHIMGGEYWKFSNNKITQCNSSAMLIGSMTLDNIATGSKHFEIIENDMWHCNYGAWQETFSLASASYGEVAYNKVHDNINSVNNNVLLLDVKNGSNHIEVHHNEIWQTSPIDGRSIGIYIDGLRKGLHHVNVHHNHIHEVGQGIRLAAEAWGDGNDLFQTDCKVYNNIIHDVSNKGIAVGWGDADHLAGASLYQRTYIYNNTIYNSARWGIYINLRETAPGVGGAHAEDNYIYNNIIWNTGEYSIWNRIDPHKSFTIDNNIVASGSTYDEAGGSITNNITGDPLFVDAANNDLHLQDGSSAIGTAREAVGNPWFSPSDDYDANSRPGGTDNDIGAYKRERAASENKGFVIKAGELLPFTE